MPSPRASEISLLEAAYSQALSDILLHPADTTYAGYSYFDDQPPTTASGRESPPHEWPDTVFTAGTPSAPWTPRTIAEKRRLGYIPPFTAIVPDDPIWAFEPQEQPQYSHSDFLSSTDFTPFPPSSDSDFQYSIPALPHDYNDFGDIYIPLMPLTEQEAAEPISPTTAPDPGSWAAAWPSLVRTVLTDPNPADPPLQCISLPPLPSLIMSAQPAQGVTREESLSGMETGRRNADAEVKELEMEVTIRTREGSAAWAGTDGHLERDQEQDKNEDEEGVVEIGKGGEKIKS